MSDEPASTVHRLAVDFGAQAVVLFGVRGTYGDALLQPAANHCFKPVSGSSDAAQPLVLIVQRECQP
jgi:hypothetical protein